MEQEYQELLNACNESTKFIDYINVNKFSANYLLENSEFVEINKKLFALVHEWNVYHSGDFPKEWDRYEKAGDYFLVPVKEFKLLAHAVGHKKFYKDSMVAAEPWSETRELVKDELKKEQQRLKKLHKWGLNSAIEIETDDDAGYSSRII